MGKSKFGLGLVLGGLAGYYLTTEDGQKLLSKVKAEVENYQDNPQAYHDTIKSKVTDFAKDLAALYDQRDEIVDQFTEFQEELPDEFDAETGADVDDIIIDYGE